MLALLGLVLVDSSCVWRVSTHSITSACVVSSTTSAAVTLRESRMAAPSPSSSPCVASQHAEDLRRALG